LKEPDETKKELSIINEDLENYFANTIIPQLFVDRDLILRKFTPPTMKQFSFTQKDLDRKMHDVKDNLRYPTIIENIEEVMATNEVLEKEVQTTDGKWFQMNILPYFVRKENKTNGVIITFVEITQRINTLKEMQKLHYINETMVYTLTHDLSQPISAIYLLTQILKESYENQDTLEFNRILKVIKDSTKNMISLVKEFGESNKEEIGLADKSINIENVYQDVSLALRDEIYKNNVSISTEFNTSEVIFSKNNLRSILYNLLYNAIKFRKTDEQLKIIISTEKQEDYVILSVRDNGMGIAKENLEKIFERSTRLNKTLKEPVWVCLL